ncbi:hypothetical protein TNCV_3319491 [Trichonephila clavipes]|nr:hypothetical protein TNCV_3319491 [Trichonephila clavipes]
MDLSEPLLNGHELTCLKRMCNMLWTEIALPAYGHLPLQPKDLQQLPIVYCKAKHYFRFIYRERSNYSQMIIDDVSRLRSGLTTKVQQTCTLPVPCCYVKKQSFQLRGVQYAQRAHVGLKQPTQHPTTSRTTLNY